VEEFVSLGYVDEDNSSFSFLGRKKEKIVMS
jgi:hypothetical protein